MKASVMPVLETGTYAVFRHSLQQRIMMAKSLLRAQSMGAVIILTVSPIMLTEKLFTLKLNGKNGQKGKHLQSVAKLAGPDAIYLEMETIDTRHRLGYAACLSIEGAMTQRETKIEYEKVSESLRFKARQGASYSINKLVCIYTSRDVDKGDLQSSCLDYLEASAQQGFDANLHRHVSYWVSLWDDCDCIITGDVEATRALRFNIYHLLISANKHDPRVNIGAKTLSEKGIRACVLGY